MPGESFLYGTAILAVVGLANRGLGFIYRVLTVRLVGPEGIGLYEMVFPAYLLVLVLVTAGIPVALARITAAQVAMGRPRQALRLLGLSLAILLGTGLTALAGLSYLAPVLASYFFPDPRAYGCFAALAPALVFVSLSSALRGWFQGWQDMVPPALAQLAEQLVRISLGLSAATLLAPRGIEHAAVGLSLGTVAGEAVGFLLLAVRYLRHRSHVCHVYPRQPGAPLRPLLNEMYALAAPVTFTRVAASLALVLEATLIPQRLQAAGYGIRAATELYGQYTGIALTLLHLPSIVTSALAVSLVPAISEALAAKDLYRVQHRCSAALRLTILTSLPFAVIFYYLPDHLTGLLFATPEAGMPLQVLAWGSLFVYLQQTTGGILQGLGEVKAVFYHFLVGTALTLGGIYLLTGLPGYGIKGTALAANIGAIAMAVLNLLTVIRRTGLTLSLTGLVLGPLAGALVMAGLLVNSYPLLAARTGAWATVTLAILLSLAGYCLTLLVTRTVTRRDLRQLPWIGQLFA